VRPTAPQDPPLGHLLTLVPTPIGNLDDITLRALAVLRSADVVAAEDTRRSKILLDRHAIATPLVRLDAHTIAARGPAILTRHRHVAYVTDAGTPGISDPGAELARLAIGLGVRVEALPGPTAFVPALVLSGLPVHRFTFEGFLPRKGRDRRARLSAIAQRDHTTALYESAVRLPTTLADLAEACGPERWAAVARELSKRFETVERGSLAALGATFAAAPARGEIVVVVGPAGGGGDGAREGGPGADLKVGAGADLKVGVGADRKVGTQDPDAADALARAKAADGLWGRDLRAALEATGVDRDTAYRLAVRHGRRPRDGAEPDPDAGG
jgi:16S rRNA (cytidine1402-2'-O)-methyltransferase